MLITLQIKMTSHDIIYKILKKIKENQEPLPTGDFLFNELKDELMVGEFSFRFFLDDLGAEGYVKITKQNITDWGEIQILPMGLNYISQFIPNEHTDIDYNNFWDFLEQQIIKNTEDLIQAKSSAELHLQTQIETFELQKSLAERGKRNILGFMHKQVDFARQEVYRIDKELEKRRILSMSTANRIGGNNNAVKNVPSATIQVQTDVEEEWKNEAKAKGLKVGTGPYHNFIQNKKQEQKEKEDEEIRKKDFEYYVGKDNIYCPTLEKFKQQLAIQKMNPDKFKYATWLWDEQVRYTTAKHYYDKWGGRGGLIDRHELYGEIIDLLNIHIEHGINTIEPNEVTVKSLEKNRKIENEKIQVSDTTSTEEESIDNIINNFDNIPIIDVYNHFYNSFVKAKHLTESELIAYLRCAFDEQKRPEQLLKLHNPPTKQKVMKVFYDYYKNVAGKPHGKQKKYAALLGNYFEGYTTDSVSTNFNK